MDMKLRKSRPLPSPTQRERPPSTAVIGEGNQAHVTSMGSQLSFARSWLPASSLSNKSRTLQYAEQPTANHLSNRKALAIEQYSGLTSRQHAASSMEDQWTQGTHIAPSTRSEVYWAGRALVAEMQVSERNRAQDQLEHAQRNHEERVSRLERFVIALTTMLAFIIIVLLFRNGASTGHTPGGSAFRPHLTIPILSPFTTIVEHEMSHMSFRTTALLIVVGAFVVYLLVCRWLDKSRK